jgi:hypothetical protein
MCSLRLLLSRRFRWIDGASVRSSTRRGRCQGPPVAPVIGGSALQGKLLICKALRDWLQTRSAAHRSFAILRLAGSRPPPLAWAWSAPSLVAPSPQPRRFPARQPVLHRSSAGGGHSTVTRPWSRFTSRRVLAGIWFYCHQSGLLSIGPSPYFVQRRRFLISGTNTSAGRLQGRTRQSSPRARHDAGPRPDCAC